MEQKIKAIVKALTCEISAYDVYVEYCNCNNITIDTFKFNKCGIDKLFSMPSEAVEFMLENDLSIGDYNFIYLEDGYRYCYSDDIETIPMKDIAKWIINAKYDDIMTSCNVLDSLQFPYYVAKQLFDYDTDDFYKFIEWLDDCHLDTYSLLKTDWKELISQFNEYKTGE